MHAVVLIILSSAVSSSLCSNGVPVAVLPPLEVRAMYPHDWSPGQAGSMVPHSRVPEEPFERRGSFITERRDAMDPNEHSAENDPLDDFMRAIGVNDSEAQGTRAVPRITSRDFEYQGYPMYQQRLYPQIYTGPQSRPNIVSANQIAPYQVPSRQGPAYQGGPSQGYQPAPVKPYQPSSKTFSLLEPLAGDLFKPFTTKVSNKVGGLLSLVLALLGTSSAGSGLTGLKDVLINGIIKPLFQMKGGLKALISKMAIPLIALLLINVEVLITIWWLWDECEVQKPVYHQPPQYHYNKPVYPSANYNPYN